jgi:hypothetical protein
VSASISAPVLSKPGGDGGDGGAYVGTPAGGRPVTAQAEKQG